MLGGYRVGLAHPILVMGLGDLIEGGNIDTLKPMPLSRLLERLKPHARRILEDDDGSKGS